MSKTKRVKRKRSNETIYFDYSLLAVLIFLVCFGLVMLYSTSAYSALVNYSDSMYYFKRQILFCIVGFIGMYMVSRIDYHYYIKWARGIYFVAVVMMALVQTPLLGYAGRSGLLGYGLPVHGIWRSRCPEP